MNLNKYQSTYIDQPGMYEVTITEEKTIIRPGKECVFVILETEKRKTKQLYSMWKQYFKFRLAQSAGLTESQRANFAGYADWKIG